MCEDSQQACWYACVCVSVCVCEEVEGLSGAPHGMSVQTADTKKVKKEKKENAGVYLLACHALEVTCCDLSSQL